ncbi:penicillin-binding protein 2 [Acidithiobacillus montserratensis]|uniref:Penicillin-binding protein 2 n=1 Tax=Acidithiobacillus montserratensis TaxID=2729135 RepID=A0ACD5HGK4_9PROT|nr:penicillin-binding protein 2 [Acidithiobacillus montserratensis]MBN2679850.1 penicillin-binding protein 2 [Acidithiobacillaceae bacterium]MBU2746874.1 penicillin-binding protein 2 [Acidithiobacillus montserratensis]
MTEHTVKILPSGRARWLILILLLGFAAVLARDLRLQLLEHQSLRSQGRMRYLRTLPLPSERGVIKAVNGEPLAVNVKAVTIWADPAILDKQQKHWLAIARVLHLSPASFAERVASGGADYAYILRQISPALGKKLEALQVPGIYVQHTSRSYYPLGAVTAPLLGMVNLQHQGGTGLELGYNQWLAAHPGQERVLEDGHGQIVHVDKILQLPRAGHALQLTINPQIQYWAYMTLLAAQRHFGASNGSAVVMDVRTGQVLAMASVPSCNPNNLGSCSNPMDYVDNAVHQAFEPGSVIKPFAIAAALATHSVSPTARFNVFHPLWVGGYPITDDVRHHILNIEHILKYSSCIGTAKIALKTPRRDIYAMYRAVGFGDVPQIGLPGTTAGVLPAWEGWGKARHATISIGYGISVTTLQLADAYAAIANGGYHIRPVLVKGEPLVKRRVMPFWVANDLRRWLRSVAEPNGTGILAAIPGYAVAGKTGTADLANGKDGFFHHRTNATFVGFAPGRDPQLVMAVTLRDSDKFWNFGGVEAAPVFRVTMEHALQQLDIGPEWCGKAVCRLRAPVITTAQAEIWSEGGGN